ncbi:sigma-54-dependent transcriptional regulator [Paramaledivibacter caminithermalis]|jgi:DNA-binding NtrC family response regulator|uniref:Stage 0 sporulation protein A homolog n=1 Tax=Paramaledivibacter caminithermalis (strain DSM 15212 / CIP 107654 / DViRD3) TaxID=1121301 RepID=A0A1M6LR45_PARC5|nr:sigma-54 dependent transcriptional regulator [Paramaledivibacter caminithermalis]SHJ73704.1 two-component system, NtrC family, response regulator AtoC [Paramaledivibacter caminithermalis DSM 15212]
MYRLLIIDDEEAICRSLQFAFEDKYKTLVANNFSTVEKYTSMYYFDVILLDLKFGEINGLEVLKYIKNKIPECQIIIMTAYSSIDSSIKAMKLGAWDYVLKPLSLDNLKIIIDKALEHKDLSCRLQDMQDELSTIKSDKIIGKSKSMKDVFNLINKVKNIDVNVLITGESGTGKELVAREIHYNGKRKKGRFEAVNCGAIPKNLIESEMFGYEKGAFTGAIKTKKGKFVLADGGTLFLDEIGEMDFDIQVKLLRVIQDKIVYPIGSEEGIKVDVRIIAATNKNLLEEIDKGNFREDLYYRLNVINVKMPSLRERIEDIPLLVEHFIKKYNSTLNKNIKAVSPEALQLLKTYNYKGNIRELENILERAVILTENEMIDIYDLPYQIINNDNVKISDDKLIVSVYETFDTIEEKVIRKALEKIGNKRKTAKILGISERTLWNKIKKYGI